MLYEHIDEVVKRVLKKLPIDSLKQRELHIDYVIETVLILSCRIQTIRAWILHLDKLWASEQWAERSKYDIEVSANSTCIDVKDKHCMVDSLIWNVKTFANAAKPVYQSLSLAQIGLWWSQLTERSLSILMHASYRLMESHLMFEPRSFLPNRLLNLSSCLYQK